MLSVAKKTISKTRKVERTVAAEESSLTEQTTRELTKQYLAQRPERLGELLAGLPKETLEEAIESIDCRNFLQRKEAWNSPLSMNDSVAILCVTSSEAEELTYSVLRCYELPYSLFCTLKCWYEDWVAANINPEARGRKLESDGSATLQLEPDLDELADAIERRTTEIQEEKGEKGEDDDNEDDDEDNENYDYDGEVELLHEEICEFLDNGAGIIFKAEAENQRLLYGRKPKITIRYSGEA